MATIEQPAAVRAEIDEFLGGTEMPEGGKRGREIR
jgi:hypothetical protein